MDFAKARSSLKRKVVSRRRTQAPEIDCDQVTSRLGERIVEFENMLREACEGNASGRRRYDPNVHTHLKPILRES